MSKAIAVGDRTLMLHIWDTAGQEKVKPERKYNW
jgi:hypothetical protein